MFSFKSDSIPSNKSKTTLGEILKLSIKPYIFLIVGFVKFLLLNAEYNLDYNSSNRINNLKNIFNHIEG